MKMKRLAAAAAAASLAAIAFVGSASPANAWDKKMCEKTWAMGKDHRDCDKFKTTTTKKKHPTTTKKAEETTTTKASPSTTVKSEVKKPTPVKVQPKFTG